MVPVATGIADYSYDGVGNMTRMTRAAGDSTNVWATDYAYDGLNRVRTETQYPSWPTTTPTLITTTTYDPDSNRTSVVDPLGQTTQFAYDALNRLTSVTYVGGGAPNVAYGYDGHGNRLTMADGTGSTSYTYDEQNRLLSVTSPGSVVVGYRYDLDGNRRKLLYPDATAVTSTFDKADRLQAIQDWASRITSYTYFPDGHLQTSTNVNGTTQTLSEDNAQRLTQVWNKTGGGATISKHAYTLDAVGNRTQVQETLALWRSGSASPTITYSYDKLSRLTQEQAPGYTSTYTYDPVGNRTQFNQGGTPVTSSYDKADRIQTAGNVAYTVNANGNLTTRGTDTFTYDQANRLTSIHQGRVTTQQSATTNTYDGDGKRVTMSESTQATITYVYDVNRSLPAVLQDGLHKNVWGLGLAYTVSMDGQNTVQVVHTDGLGSVRALTDSSGTVVQDYQTDAFGVPTQTEGPNASQRFQYAGEQRDSDGLVYLRARFYDPGTGRFVSRDPSLGNRLQPCSLHRYSYADNDPTNLIDASGLAASRVLRFSTESRDLPWGVSRASGDCGSAEIELTASEIEGRIVLTIRLNPVQGRIVRVDLFVISHNNLTNETRGFTISKWNLSRTFERTYDLDAGAGTITVTLLGIATVWHGLNDTEVCRVGPLQVEGFGRP
jgi:RHS repeat-associated protein